MKRRQFIHIAAIGSVAAALPSGSWALEDSSALRVLAAPHLPALLGSHEAALRIGRAFREQYRHEYSAPLLRKVISEDAELSRATTARQVCDRLDQRIREDFERGRTVRLDGWILSQTEARQTALYCILNA